MTDRELMQQALEALKFGLHVGFDESSESQIKKNGRAFDQHSKAIKDLRERLAQPEQGPVATNDTSQERVDETSKQRHEAQPEGCQCPACKVTPHASDCAAHNEPAYPNGECDCGAQPEQEPVAWLYQYKPAGTRFVTLEMASAINHQQVRETPLYTSLPHRKPLTDEEIEEINVSLNGKRDLARMFARAIEAAHGIKE